MGDFREQRDDGGRGPSPDNKYPPRRGDSRERRDDPRGPPPSEESASVIVRNISFRVYPDEIHRLFSYYGRLKDVYIPRVSQNTLLV